MRWKKAILTRIGHGNQPVTTKSPAIGKIWQAANADDRDEYTQTSIPIYEVTVKTIEMHEGKEKETLKSFHIKAGDKKHLGCSLSDVMPLTSYKRVIVKETQ